MGPVWTLLDNGTSKMLDDSLSDRNTGRAQRGQCDSSREEHLTPLHVYNTRYTKEYREGKEVEDRGLSCSLRSRISQLT